MMVLMFSLTAAVTSTPDTPSMVLSVAALALRYKSSDAIVGQRTDGADRLENAVKKARDDVGHAIKLLALALHGRCSPRTEEKGWKSDD